MITHKQLTLAEVFEDCQNNFDNDKYQFLSLLDEAINLDEIVPVSFVTHFHVRTGRPRKHQLCSVYFISFFKAIIERLSQTVKHIYPFFHQMRRQREKRRPVCRSIPRKKPVLPSDTFAPRPARPGFFLL